MGVCEALSQKRGGGGGGSGVFAWYRHVVDTYNFQYLYGMTNRLGVFLFEPGIVVGSNCTVIVIGQSWVMYPCCSYSSSLATPNGC